MGHAKPAMNTTGTIIAARTSSRTEMMVRERVRDGPASESGGRVIARKVSTA
jgi:hypothetical protein